MKRIGRKSTEQIWDQLQRIHGRLLKRIEKRAADPSMKDIAGGETGLLVRKERRLRGTDTVAISYEVDTVTLKRERAILERSRILTEKPE